MTRGSRQYWPHRRAARLLPRVRSLQTGKGEPRLGGMVAYKAGMSTALMVDDSESPSKQQEVSRACTVLDVPTTEFYGIRFYKNGSITGYRSSAAEVCHKATAQKLKISPVACEDKLGSLMGRLGEYTDISALLVAHPKSAGAEQNKFERFEVQIIGKTLDEKFSFASQNLGKEVRPEMVFKQGEYIDVSSITKGKGWQGIIKRYGAARLSHKATQKIRHIGTHGDFGGAKVMYTVPQPGQMGFNYRTERNKRILRIGGRDAAGSINKPSGFKNYGNVKGNYVIVEGSIPGPARRLVRIRLNSSRLNAKGIKQPKVLGIG